ncbi:CYFA0S23e01662g1_1 [Cyberlindnera fabianii]|uniref:CYFA0S23e01662g1_1 n=1 Tax=Cyberlindnera fabianii TaxID=36022 RepID=A0A061BAV7_CYBFA|nr:Inositol phosphorylceramide synthase regulatory subunit KEI1 [Cyberlindnera fabianii]CDR46504.1 CYFA0S23e01662g1_1 [Cyberlindnera fabianii]
MIPQRFFGFLPLYVGVEVILATAILNKMHGIFGILSLFTGHPLDLMQWVYYIVSFVMVYYYFVGFTSILKPRPLQHAAIVVIYSVDTLFSLLYIFYFAAEWLLKEDTTAPYVPGQDYSKSATQFYEYSVIFLTTAIVEAARAYFNLVLFSFYTRLLKYNKDLGLSVMDGDVDLDLKNRNKFQQLCYKFEVHCHRFLNDHFKV